MKRIAIGMGLLVLASSAAVAQQGGGGPAIGSTNSSAVVSNNRDQNAAYNRVIGDQNQRPIKKGKAVAAKPSDVTPGSALRDINGLPVGTVQAVEGQEAIVQTAAGRVRIPLIGFGKDRAGLMLGMTAAELQAAVTAANQGG